MPKHISIELHLSLPELEKRYRQANDPLERSHYQIIWLLASGRISQSEYQVNGNAVEFFAKNYP